MDKLLTEKQVSEIVGFKRTRLFQMIKAGDFPPPKKYGRNNRWFESDIEQWLIKEKEEHDNEQGLFTHVGKAIDDLLS
jgi:prophage regulatory protein